MINSDVQYEERSAGSLVVRFYQDDAYYYLSIDGGVTFDRRQLYNDVETVWTHQQNKYYVQHILNPPLSEGESLCHFCANEAKVGISRFAGYESGTETEAKEVYEGEDEPVVKDVSFGVRYAVWRCSNCNKVTDSDYA